ncbi:MAG TPA: transcriptional regulator PpsR [Hyphomicrobiaceae bacterium]|nr:transcriptional regulator PpsR [Hyphomicrobiaceae bacterium]
MRSLRKAISSLNAEAATRLVTVATDLAVMMDPDGTVCDVAICSDSLSKESDVHSWIGRNWIDTVTIESRPKIAQLLSDASTIARQGAQWRQVNHPNPNGRGDLPVRYATMRIGQGGRILALGRELRSMSLLQQKLLETQQAVEREHARVRSAETRFRLLFQIAGDAVIIADAATLRISDANPAAQHLLEPAARRISGKTVVELFQSSSQGAVQRMLDGLRTSGRADPLTSRLANARTEVVVTGSLFKQEATAHLLLRLVPADVTERTDAPSSGETLRALVESMPDAFVVSGLDRRVLMANAAFLELAQMSSLEQIRGQPLDRWVGRTPAETNLLIGSLREHGSVRSFRTVVQGELGSSDDVEVSAVTVESGEQPCFGFTIRSIGRQLAAEGTLSQSLPRSASQLAGLVGQVPLKNLVREATDLIERMCIETALQIVDDNRASAAEMLGLSRQSLYMKMRRYGLNDPSGD